MYMVSQVPIAEGIADGTDCQGWPDGTNNRVTSSRIHIMNIIAIYYWVPGLGSIQFRNWNCSSIPIPIPELELKLVELKMELELKPLELELELELKTGIEFFATATTALTS